MAVVGLAKVESPAIEAGVAAAGFPPSFVGVVIALLVLLPETLAAVRAARRNRIQTSLNLALGSAMASIGLTIPAIAVATIWLDGPLLLGLGATQMVLLALTVVVGVLTVVPGRATRLQGVVHLVLLAAFVFLRSTPEGRAADPQRTRPTPWSAGPWPVGARQQVRVSETGSEVGPRTTGRPSDQAMGSMHSRRRVCAGSQAW